MKFAKENFTQIYDEIAPLSEAHYKEIAHYQDIPLNPDLMKYEMLERGGVLRTFTMRTDTGELVGYAIFIVQHNLHYKDSLQAIQDVIFLRKENRGTGGNLIKYCDNKLRVEGVQVVYQHVKFSHDFGPLLERMGYHLVEKIYGKRLDQGGS